jgi:DNA-binding winged helix-turn-helix (wHTH) protein
MPDQPSLAAGSQFVFGDFHMDVARYRLSRGQREVPLPPKAWDVLYCLIKRPSLLITKEALHDEIWPDIAISDDTLTKRIGELRRALGDTRRTPRFIETVHGRGFRFVADVREVSDERQEHSVDADAQPLATGAGAVEPAVRPSYTASTRVFGGPARVSDSSSSSPARPASARQRSWKSSSVPRRCGVRTSMSCTASASSSTDSVSPTCRCWRRSSVC